jgi:signal transduction histidine kinase
MLVAACLTLTFMHLVAWIKLRSEWSHFFFAMATAATAAITSFEFLALRAESVAEVATLMRWVHVPTFFQLVGVVWFVRFHFGAGEPWLVWTICGLRAIVTVASLASNSGVFFSDISSLERVVVPGGESISLARGPLSPWYIAEALSIVAVVAYLVDVTVTVWRQGGTARRRSLVLFSSSFSFFLLAVVTHVTLIHTGVVNMPYLDGFFFMPTVIAMTYDLGSEVFRAAQLTRQLQVSEAGLRESEARMDLAASAAQLALWVWDIGRDELWTTDKGREMFGLGKSERVDLDRFLGILHPEDRERVAQSVANAVNGGGEYESEHRVVLPGDQVHWLAGRGRVEFDRNGVPERMRGVSLDITRRKQVELQLQQQRTELAHLSRVTSLGELSGSLAHELNQPLGAILSNAQAALHYLDRDVPDLGEVRDILEDIVADDKRAGEVIRRLRALLRKDEEVHQLLDANELIGDVLHLMRSELDNRGVTPSVELMPDLPRINGDRVQLEQVLLNLVVNACDAMTDAAKTDRQLRLRTARTTDAFVSIIVSDRGKGILPEHLERIFEPFFTTKEQGLGLGLAVCRTIVAAHHGRLWASSNGDGGASFHLSLPGVHEQGS